MPCLKRIKDIIKIDEESKEIELEDGWVTTDDIPSSKSSGAKDIDADTP